MSPSTVSHLKPQGSKIVLALQGGGALGAYHIGAYQALAEHNLHPDWVSGISIGAINSAVIAGNPPEERVAKLDELWRAISWPDLLLGFTQWRLLQNMVSNAWALTFGQPNFFRPRPINPFLVPSTPAQSVSFYDTTPMTTTLRHFVDFARINERHVRLSLGATNVATGDIKFFDNTCDVIGPEHVLASGSLPPGFPATQVGPDLYWDGGCVANTPLDAIIDESDHPHMVVFMIDLWKGAGEPPRSMNEVLWRAKQIQYASRVARHIDAVATKVNLRHAVHLMKRANVAEVAAVPDSPLLRKGRLDIVHVTYHPGPDQIPNSDAEFSRASIAERREAGYRDLKAAIADAPWLRQELPAHLGALVHRVERQRVTTLPEPNLKSMDAREPAAA
ncbi:patatin-like phospholipase family protein [Paraburkholderia sp. LEh10]|uniref:patatin-like phospholipase family protein n=1 Tax=Paraburkholderia sp. LEh10 TaxID=2821353 RepID=UPI001AEA2C56|nr:patatin-like phospholipase family protein [Paraburkholderia sp. LEh10]MBP0588165.1 patatin-like phospholipase family protein [Paraburkholderia sp. LEh10]